MTAEASRRNPAKDASVHQKTLAPKDTLVQGATKPPLSRLDDGPIAMLTLDHQASRNSLPEAMMAALQEKLDAIAREKTIRAVILAATGPVFCVKDTNVVPGGSGSLSVTSPLSGPPFATVSV